MSVSVGTTCAGCLDQRRSMLLFEIVRGQPVCAACFDRTWPHLIAIALEEMTEAHNPRTSE